VVKVGKRPHKNEEIWVAMALNDGLTQNKLKKSIFESPY
jgi:hypothetical protein